MDSLEWIVKQMLMIVNKLSVLIVEDVKMELIVTSAIVLNL